MTRIEFGVQWPNNNYRDNPSPGRKLAQALLASDGQVVVMEHGKSQEDAEKVRDACAGYMRRRGYRIETRIEGAKIYARMKR